MHVSSFLPLSGEALDSPSLSPWVYLLTACTKKALSQSSIRMPVHAARAT